MGQPTEEPMILHCMDDVQKLLQILKYTPCSIYINIRHTYDIDCQVTIKTNIFQLNMLTGINISHMLV